MQSSKSFHGLLAQFARLICTRLTCLVYILCFFSQECYIHLHVLELRCTLLSKRLRINSKQLWFQETITHWILSCQSQAFLTVGILPEKHVCNKHHWLAIKRLTNVSCPKTRLFSIHCVTHTLCNSKHLPKEKHRVLLEPPNAAENTMKTWYLLSRANQRINWFCVGFYFTIVAEKL